MLRKLNAFRIISILFAIITIFFACSILINPDSTLISANYTQLFMGCTLLFSSLSDFKENRKRMAILNLLISIFVLSVFAWVLMVH
ncbi:DUF3953 domain-containing protein [Paenibacillus glacialis]|uniref:DUF3953 domain-containing protein n=1 Tax=Paenibacillus glacialis TaxID=494026 RepID=A0A168L2X6_9BACL|nr:hypothetical protein PGLA_10185 [Paenibacillus glacialis]